jgi:hypothetical protein
VLVEGHVDALAAEFDALEAEAEALLVGGVAFELYFAAGSYDALPREFFKLGGSEEFGYGSVVERVACGGGDFAVSGDLALGDGADDAAEGGVAGFLEVLRDDWGAHGWNFIRG